MSTATITANDIKTRGVQAIREAMTKNKKEAFISVRGNNEFVVLPFESYDRLRNYELDIAYLESMMDIANGDYKEQTAQEHIEQLFKRLKKKN